MKNLVAVLVLSIFEIQLGVCQLKTVNIEKVESSIALRIQHVRNEQNLWLSNTNRQLSAHNEVYKAENLENEFTLRFKFSGSTLDYDLVNFYEFLLQYDPKLLRPRLVDFGYFETQCEKSKLVCATDGEVMLASGQLAHKVPERLESRVLLPLRSILADAGKIDPNIQKGLIPGIRLIPFNKIRKLYKSQGFKGNEYCLTVRFDGLENCIVYEASDSVVVAEQGLRADLVVEESEAINLVEDFHDYIKGSTGQKLGNISVIVLESTTSQNASKPLSDSDVNCVVNDTPVNLSENFQLHKKVIGYENGTKLSPEHSPPDIVIVDNLGTDIDAGTYKLANIDWKAKQNFTHASCKRFQVPTQADAEHAKFIISQLIAPNNSNGVGGLLPSYPQSNLEVFNAPLNDNLTDFSVGLSLRKHNTIASISLHTDTTRNEDLFNDLKNNLMHLRSNILIVASAGQSVNGSDGKLLSESNCRHLPGCLGELNNVITVAALDTDSPSQIWRQSHRGGKKVSVIAPGTLVVSRYPDGDFSFENSKEFVTGDGTSFAVPFVTAIAADIWMRKPSLSAAEVKSRIIASSKAFIESHGERALLKGESGDVAGGTIDFKYARESLNSSILKDEYSYEKIGKVIPNGSQSKFGFVLSVTQFDMNPAKECDMSRMLRLHRAQDNTNYFYAACENTANDSITFTEGYLKVRNGMPCAHHGNCFFFTEGDLSQMTEVDLAKTSDIYFGAN